MTDSTQLINAFTQMSNFEQESHNYDFTENDFKFEIEDIAESHGFDGFVGRMLWLEWKTRPDLEQQQKQQWFKQYNQELAVS